MCGAQLEDSRMFSNLSAIAKALAFYGLAFGLGLCMVLLAPLLGDQSTALPKLKYADCINPV
jgi:hypothetical protein